MNLHSIHFPPPDLSPAKGADSQLVYQNIILTLSEVLRDTETLREKMRGLLVTDSRHGDLQVALSCARRIEAGIQVLIEAEERTA